MGRKRASLATGSSSGGGEKSKKSKKRRRESEPGASGGGASEKRRSSSSSSKEVVLRLAPADTMSPLVVSFANQTMPVDVESIQFEVHEGEDEGREGQRVLMGSGSRLVIVAGLAMIALGRFPNPRILV